MIDSMHPVIILSSHTLFYVSLSARSGHKLILRSDTRKIIEIAEVTKKVLHRQDRFHLSERNNS